MVKVVLICCVFAIFPVALLYFIITGRVKVIRRRAFIAEIILLLLYASSLTIWLPYLGITHLTKPYRLTPYITISWIYLQIPISLILLVVFVLIHCKHKPLQFSTRASSLFTYVSLSIAIVVIGFVGGLLVFASLYIDSIAIAGTYDSPDGRHRFVIVGKHFLGSLHEMEEIVPGTLGLVVKDILTIGLEDVGSEEVILKWSRDGKILAVVMKGREYGSGYDFVADMEIYLRPEEIELLDGPSISLADLLRQRK